MQVISDDAGRYLNSKEKVSVKKAFNKADVSRMKYLGAKGMIIDSAQEDYDSL